MYDWSVTWWEEISFGKEQFNFDSYQMEMWGLRSIDTDFAICQETDQCIRPEDTDLIMSCKIRSYLVLWWNLFLPSLFHYCPKNVHRNIYYVKQENKKKKKKKRENIFLGSFSTHPPPKNLWSKLMLLLLFAWLWASYMEHHPKVNAYN